MNYFLAFVALLLAFAVLRLALIVVALALAIAVLVALIRRPGHTLLFLGCMVVIGLASAHPVACIIALGVVGLATAILGVRRNRPRQMLLTDGREQDPG